MNIHGMPQPGMGPGIIPVGVSPVMMQQNSPQQPPQMQNVMPQQQQQQQQQMQAQQNQNQPPADNISKVKLLLGPLRENLSLVFKSAAYSIQKNNMMDNLKKDASNPAKFEKHLEDFYAVCDQIEMHLTTAAQCVQQQNSSQKYLPGVVNGRGDGFLPNENMPNQLSYPQYLATVRSHVASAKDLHDTLISAAQNISQSD